jgi:hypothetical protein
VSLERFRRTVSEALAAEKIPAMLTGSMAAAYRGAIRATMDVDLVIDPEPSALERFVARLEGAGFYASPDAAREALRSRGMFNVIDPESGWKADLIVRKARPFSEAEFSRRQPLEFLGVPLAIARTEDLIIAKLEWASLGGSARQLEDVRSLVRLAGADLDRGYVDRWTHALQLTALWQDVQRLQERGP